MTKPSMALAELAEKGAEGDIVHDLLAEIPKAIMEFEVRQRCGAD